MFPDDTDDPKYDDLLYITLNPQTTHKGLPIYFFGHIWAVFYIWSVNKPIVIAIKFLNQNIINYKLYHRISSETIIINVIREKNQMLRESIIMIRE